MNPVVLDCDTGTDDAIAIMIAALSARIELVAVTTVAGNVPVDVVAENSLRVLQHIGCNAVPVFRGARTPLTRPSAAARLGPSATFEMHGEYLDLPPAGRPVERSSAIEELCRQSREAREGGRAVTLVATGPLTNLALCLRQDAHFTEGIDRLVVMGGGHAVGNVTPSAEFNFWADPEAARSVLGAGFRNLTLVPLDATHAATVGARECDDLRRCGTPAAAAAAGILEQRIGAHDRSQPMAQAGTAPVHDALCVALLIAPEVVELSRLHVDVEVSGELTTGRSVIDVHHRSGHEATADVALGADAPLFRRLLLDVLCGD